MQSPFRHRLSDRQKWQLAISIVLIYLPIRIYVSNSTMNLTIFESKLALWTIEVLLNIVFFKIWIDIIEYLEHLFEWIDVKIRFKLPSQLVTLLIGLVLALVFNFLFNMLWREMHHLLRANFGIGIEYAQLGKDRHVLEQKIKGNTGLTVLAMLATFYLASSRSIYQRLKDVQIKAERLEKENLHAQLAVLKNQLSPHFLFNSFSILASLIENDPVKSVEFVESLAKSYRYILEQSSFEQIQLQTELDFIETYVFLLKSRFEDKIEVVIEPEVLRSGQYKIVPLTLQLLIENAVKHNQMSEEKPLVITLKIVEKYLEISNPIRLRPVHGSSTGLGLDNIINRYRLITEDQVTVDNSNANFTVKIPLLK
jgi:two-component system, LytTR family, sensor kinase